MTKRFHAILTLLLTGSVAVETATVALAAPTAAQNCQSAKLKVAGKYDGCRLLATSIAVKQGGTPDFLKCDQKFDDKWQAAEDDAAGMCPTAGDLTPVKDIIADHTDLLAQMLSGGSTEDPDAVYVTSDAGTDSGTCGTLAAPCATIGFGLARAQADAKLRVYVSNHAYSEDVALIDGIDLLGGYDPATWAPTANPSVLYGLGGAGHRAAISAIGITSATSLEGFVVHAANATTAGANSYGILVRNSGSQLDIQGNVIYAGAGAPGAAAAAGGDGADGVDGSGRDSNPGAYDSFLAIGTGACNASNNRQQTNGASQTCGATIASGGNGGGNRCPVSSSLTEFSGIDGSNATSGGTGGDAGDDSQIQSSGSSCVAPAGSAIGAAGTDGPDGISALPGAGCTATGGIVIADNWIPSSGSSGPAGSAARGGGGGGAGGGGFCSSCTEGKDRLGGHGGGGGSGGCGGSGGSGGSGGGGSFGVFVSGGTAPSLTNNTIVRGAGGSGGSGGRAGHGGSGATGGKGGVANLFCASSGGDGGNGGEGGHGGGGGGGCGGSVFGIYTSTVGTPNYCMPAAANTIAGGATGSGGQGGPSAGSDGSTGSDGVLTSCSFN